VFLSLSLSLSVVRLYNLFYAKRRTNKARRTIVEQAKTNRFGRRQLVNWKDSHLSPLVQIRCANYCSRAYYSRVALSRITIHALRSTALKAYYVSERITYLFKQIYGSHMNGYLSFINYENLRKKIYHYKMMFELLDSIYIIQILPSNFDSSNSLFVFYVRW